MDAAIGIDANYALEMEQSGREWRGELFRGFAERGCTLARVRVWTGEDGPSGLDYAIRTALRAQEAGLQPYLVYFLSPSWADFVKQPSPPEWDGLDDEARAARIEAYSEATTRRFVDAGVAVSLVELGNEIDFGVAGIFEEEWPKRVSVEYMRQEHWPRVARMLAAAERGVRRVEPDARFVVHLTQWADPPWIIAFWQTMAENGVTVDVAGLTYYPTASEAGPQTFGDLAVTVEAVHTALDRPVLLAEAGYPAADGFGGQFASWNHAVPGYPLTPKGQRDWVSDLAAWTEATPNVMGAVYWSPEWYDSELWSAFALYDADGRPRPALRRWGRR